MATTTRERAVARSVPQFNEHALVRVKGTDDQVRALYGAEAVGAVGVIVRLSHRANGVNRYLVNFPAHTYITPAKHLQREVASVNNVIREDLLELAVQPKAEVPASVRPTPDMTRVSKQSAAHTRQPATERELVKAHLRTYVKRGDSYESLRMGSLAYGGPDGHMEIHLDTVTATLGDIYSPRVRFRLRDIYNELKAECRTGMTQGSLFDEVTE